MLTRGVATAIGRWVTRMSRRLEDLAAPETAAAHEQAATASFLAEASRVLASSLDHEETLTTVARLAVPHLADFCFFDLVQPDGSLRRVAWAHVDPAWRDMLDAVGRFVPPPPFETHPTAQALRTGQSVLVSEVTDGWTERAATSPEHLHFLRALRFHSVMAVPLWLRDHLLGIATFGRSTSSAQYDAHDLQVAEDLARRAAIAVDNARLYRESEQRRQETEALVEISRLLTGTLDKETVGRRIVDTLRSLLAAQVAVLGRAEPHGLVPIAVTGDVGPGLTGISAGPLTSGAIGLALQTGQTVVTADLLGDPRLSYSPEMRQRVASAPYRAALAVPLRVQHRVIGVLFVGDRLGRVFSEGDLRVALTFAEHAAVALHNAELYREAQEASRAKDEFLAVVSHELRTPLNAIYGWARMLRSCRLASDDVPRALEVIERNAVAQGQLINDLLDISRIVTRRMRLDLRPVDSVGVVDTAVDSVRPMAETKGVVIRWESGAPAVVMADPDRLRQIVSNLLLNAVKFTPAGGRVDVTLESAAFDVAIAVRDTGQGIPGDALPHVFDRFWQRDSSSTRAHGGLGIGLALVRHLVELHGGSVHADSAGEGQGATFVVRLPLSLGEPTGSPVETAPPLAVLRGRRVLVVDDDPDTRDLLSAVLSIAGAEVTASGSVADCLSEFERARPDVVVADIAMPGEDGYALLTRLRGRAAEDGGPIPVVAVTARSRREDRARALAAGFDLHLAKPIDPAELTTAVASLARRAQ